MRFIHSLTDVLRGAGKCNFVTSLLFINFFTLLQRIPGRGKGSVPDIGTILFSMRQSLISEERNSISREGTLSLGKGLYLQGRDSVSREGTLSLGKGLCLQGRDSIPEGRDSISEGKGLYLQGRDSTSREGILSLGKGLCLQGRDSIPEGRDSITEGKGLYLQGRDSISREGTPSLREGTLSLRGRDSISEGRNSLQGRDSFSSEGTLSLGKGLYLQERDSISGGYCVIRRVIAGRLCPCTGVAIDSSCRVASCGEDGTINLLDLGKEQLIHRLGK